MSMALDVGQYGGSRAPAVSPSQGGASVIGTLGTAAMGMLSGGGLGAISAAMEVAKEGTTTQTAESGKVNNTTGSKVFNSPGAGDAMLNNAFWQQQSGTTGNMVVYIALGIFGLIGLVIVGRMLK